MFTSTGGWEEKSRLKLTSAKVEVEVEDELGNINNILQLLTNAKGRQKNTLDFISFI